MLTKSVLSFSPPIIQTDHLEIGTDYPQALEDLQDPFWEICEVKAILIIILGYYLPFFTVLTFALLMP